MNFRSKFRWFACLCLAALLGPSWAQPLPDGLAELRIDVLRDTGGQLTVAELPGLAERFMPLSGSALNAGYTRDAVWLRVSVRRHADAPHEWRLEIRPAFLDDLRLYMPDADKGYRVDRQGDRLAFSTRPFPYRNPLFTLELPDDTSRQFYLRVASTSSLMVIPSVTTPEVFRERAQRWLVGLSLFFGVLIAMIAVNLLYTAALRDRFFAAYAVFLALELISFSSVEGLLAQLLFQESPAVPDRLVGLATFSAFGLGLALFRKFLGIRKHLPRLDWIVVLVSIFEFVVALASFGDYFVLLAPLGQLLLLPAMLITLAAAIMGARTGESGAAYIAAGYFVHLVFILYSALSNVGAFSSGGDPYFGLYASVMAQLLFLQVGIVARAHQAERANMALLDRTMAAQEHAAREQKLRETQSQFLNMVAHEVRTPLAVIAASTNSLRLVGEAPPHVTERIDRIERAAQRMGQLFDLCLDTERIEAGRDKPQLQAVSLFSLIAETAAELGIEPGKRLKILDETRSQEIQADPRLLKVAFANLIDNAAKYSSCDDPVEVRIHFAEPAADNSDIAVDVIDRGPGVPPEAGELIFGKFFRAEELSGVPGLGLGLYLVKRIVESHGGDVSVLAGPGGRFRITLPPARARRT